MPWNQRASRQRARLEEETAAVPLLKDVWVKTKLVLTHIAGLSSLVSTMNTELAHLRYAVERVAAEVAAYRKAGDERWGQLSAWVGDDIADADR